MFTILPKNYLPLLRQIADWLKKIGLVETLLLSKLPSSSTMLIMSAIDSVFAKILDESDATWCSLSGNSVSNLLLCVYAGMDSRLQLARSKLTNCVGEKSDKNDLLSIVHDILIHSSSMYDRYYCLDSAKLLSDNCRNHSVQNVNALIEALRILEKYGKNLLRNDRPPYWKIVRLSNPYFHKKVDNINGSRSILKQMGYSVEIEDGLSFPASVDLPDNQAVQLVTSDIILLKYELAMFLNNQHPAPQGISHYMQIRDFRVNSAKPRVNNEDKPGTSGISKKPNKIPKSLPTITECNICGQKLSDFFCPSCKMQQCSSCDKKWHLNRDRVNHKRIPMNSSTSSPKTIARNVLKQPVVSPTEHQQLSLPFASVQPSINAFPTQNTDFEISSPHGASSSSIKVESLEHFSTAKPVSNSSRPKVVTEHSFNWEERFKIAKQQLNATRDVHEQQHIVEKFCKEVDDQVKKYTDEANGLDRLVYVQQHFQQRGQELLEKKFELLKYVDGLHKPKQPQVPWDSLPNSPQDIETLLPQPSSNITSALGSTLDTNSFHVIQPPKVSGGGDPMLSSNFIDVGKNEFRKVVEMSISSTQLPVGPSGDVNITPISNYQNRIESVVDDLASIFDGDPSQFSFSKPTAIAYPPAKLRTSNERISLKKENYRTACLKTIDKLRVAEERNIKPLEMQIALSEIEKSSNPNMSIHTFMTQNLQKRIHPLLEKFPSLSFSEACQLYLKNDGDADLIQDSMKVQHSLKMKLLGQQQLCNEIDTLACLSKNNGDCFESLIELQKPMLHNFVERVQTLSKDNFAVRDFSNTKDASHLRDAIVSILSIKEPVVVEMMCAIMLECFRNINSELFKAIMDYDICDVYEASKSFPDSKELAMKYLGNQCNVCYDFYSQNKLECMTACGDNGCTYCQECLAKFLELTIREGHIRDLVCPVCKLPDTDHDDEAATTHFSYLDVVIKKYLDEQTYTVFQKKLTDQALMKMPNFRWCSHCENGFCL